MFCAGTLAFGQGGPLSGGILDPTFSKTFAGHINSHRNIFSWSCQSLQAHSLIRENDIVLIQFTTIVIIVMQLTVVVRDFGWANH